MTEQQQQVARWSAMPDDECQCGRKHSTFLGIDGDRLLFRCSANHVYRVVDPSPRSEP